MLLLSMLFSLTRHAMVFDTLLPNYLVEVLLLLPCIVLLSMLYYVLVERPCMDPHWPEHLRRRIMGQPHTAVVTK